MTDWVPGLIDAGGYWAIFALMVLENVFPPIPSELIMGIGGIRVGQGRMEMMPLLISGTLGTVVGNLFWYILGAVLGFKRLKPLVDRWGRWMTVEWDDVEAINRLFRKRGEIIVFFFRFMPAFRTIVSLPAGLFHMGWLRFIVWTTAGSVIWMTLLAYGGFILGHSFETIDQYLGPISTVAVGLMVGGYIWRLIYWKPRHRR